MRIKEFFAFIKERHMIYERKEADLPKPWTRDVILQSYRFCNVYRELDTQTKWLRENWEGDNEDYWFACCVFRLTNWHETAEELGYPVPWNSAKFLYILNARKVTGLKVYSGAYTISTNGVAMEKHLYLAEQLTKIWNNRKHLRYRSGETLQAFFERLKACNAMGSFMAAQVVADMKFAGAALEAPDWWTFAAPGPGSKRGLNRVMERPTEQPWPKATWHSALAELHAAINPLCIRAKLPELSAQNLQNCLCEFDKYERVLHNEGRPRSTYQGV